MVPFPTIAPVVMCGKNIFRIIRDDVNTNKKSEDFMQVCVKSIVPLAHISQTSVTPIGVKSFCMAPHMHTTDWFNRVTCPLFQGRPLGFLVVPCEGVSSEFNSWSKTIWWQQYHLIYYSKIINQNIKYSLFPTVLYVKSVR